MALEAIPTDVDDKDKGAHHETSTLKHKKARIIYACEQKDIDGLKDLAISSGGFCSDAIRCQAWPVLLGFRSDEPAESDGGPDSWRHMPRHRDEEQVKLDVDRSFVYYPNDDSQAQLDRKKAELSDLITEVLRRQPYLCYFQGYHDICQVFLLVLPPAVRPTAVARLSALRIRDFMLPNLEPAIAQLRLIPEILNAADPALSRHLSGIEPYFAALADTLTMFAHNVPRYRDIARLFDALLAREPVFAPYVFAQIVRGRRAELLAHDPDDPDMLHFALSKLPPDLDLDAVVAAAARLFDRHPPESLPAWRSVSGASVLKTARDVRSCADQTLDDGRRYFRTQLRELLWAERRHKVFKVLWSNRRVILAVAVGAGAIYFRKAPLWSNLLAWSRSI
ncbi:rab-GTPase-TBC domain-containing protein [Xylariaceae sp. FL0662B]|nr:rab-GTPase-TBC domain-containing protein [Xylariaceae sp. FL0662B]